MREKYKRHKNDRISTEDLKVIVMLIAVEVLFWLYAAAKGSGFMYFQIMVVLILLSSISCYIAFRYHADRYLIIWTILLLNFGYMIQMFSQEHAKLMMTGMVVKLLAAAAGAYATAFLFKRYSRLFSMDVTMTILIAVQMTLCVLLFLRGTVVGEKGDAQSALISLQVGPLSILPLEIVKMLYVFVIAILLCKEERQGTKIWGLPREMLFLLYTALLAGMMTAFSEMGTVLIILLTGAMMLMIFSWNRKVVWGTMLVSAVVLGMGLAVCFVWKPDIGVVQKVYLRLKYMAKPELDPQGAGYQGLLMRKALTVGGAWGPDTDRYLFAIPEESSDMIFVKLIQTCGFVMGIFMILSFFILLREGFIISRNAQDCYYKGLAMGITILITVETAVHIGYNIGIFPITGIPLYFVSGGATSLATGLIMAALLLVMSAGGQERSTKDETAFEKRLEENLRYILPRRRKLRRKNRVKM